MNRSRLSAVLCLVALVGFVGCDDDDLISIPQTPEQVVESVTQTLEPALIALNAGTFIGFGGVGAVSAGGCVDNNEVCSSGTAEYCYFTDTDITFSSCVSNGEMIDGTLNVAFDEGGNTLTYDMVVDGVTLAGTIGLAYSPGCVVETLTSFSVSAPGFTSSASGVLTYCDAFDFPEGSVSVTVQDSTGSMLLDYSFNTTVTAYVTVTDLATEESESCSVNLSTTEVICGLSRT